MVSPSKSSTEESNNFQDDILRRLGPSLDSYVGCTIIDINPGVGLFSTKLHEILKPKSHILVEPQLKKYGGFLNPLLKSPTGRYRAVDWPDEYRWNLDNYRKEDLVTSPSREDEVLRSKGSKFPTLIVGNLAGSHASTGISPSVKAKAPSRILDFVRKVRLSARTGNHPPPRMLLWMEESEKQSILPRTVGLRGKLACMLEGYCRVEEVVYTNITRAQSVRREDALDLTSQRLVAAKMTENKPYVPIARQETNSTEDAPLVTTSRDWHEELRILEEGFENGTISQFTDVPPGTVSEKKRGRGGHPRRAKDPRQYTPEWTRLSQLKRLLKSDNKRHLKYEPLLQDQKDIDRLWRETYGELTEEQRQQKLSQLDDLSHRLGDALSNLGDRDRKGVMLLDDERRAFHMDPPLLLWDRRPAEPMRARPDEFQAEANMTLMDIEARADLKDDNNITPTTPEQDMYYDLIANTLLGPYGPITLESLDTLGPGAYKALVDKAPSLRDPRRGGRRDVTSLRARTMTHEMLQELAGAWEGWVFKPPLVEVLNNTEPEAFGLTREGGPASRPLM